MARKRLGEDLGNAGAFGPLAVFFGDAARAEHDGDVGVVAADAFGQFDAGHLRHREIAHHDIDVRRIRRERLERFGRSRTALRAVAESGELAADESHELRLVVDDEHMGAAVR